MPVRSQPLVLIDAPLERPRASHIRPLDDLAAAGGAERDLLTAIERSGRFRNFVHLVRRAQLAADLRRDGPWTVFAPTDAAFAALDLEELDLLLSTPELLADVAEHHVVAGRVKLRDLLAQRHVATLQGDAVLVRPRAGRTCVDEAAIEQPDVHCRNGVLHVVDTLLVPAYGLRGAASPGRRIRKFHRELHVVSSEPAEPRAT